MGTSTAKIDNPHPDVSTDRLLMALGQAGIVEAWLFGSFACGEETPDNDIDLLVTFAHHVTLFERLRITEQLSEITDRKIDLFTSIQPALVPVPL